MDADGKYYEVKISVGVLGDLRTVYNVGKLKKDALPKGAQRPSPATVKTARDDRNTSSVKSVTYNTEKVKTEKFSLKNSEVANDTLFAEAKKTFGTTYNWNETGYVLPDGARLDMSGKRYGGRGGSRTEDHRDIAEVYENYVDYDECTTVIIEKTKMDALQQ